MAGITDNPFAVLSFLAAPAILTNASTVLALGTSNRLARAADRARLVAAALVGSGGAPSAATNLREKDFRNAVERARRLVRALRLFYTAAGSFAAGTCLSLLGAAAGFFEVQGAVVVSGALTLVSVVVGVTAIGAGAVLLIGETGIALRVLADEQEAIERWKSEKQVNR